MNIDYTLWPNTDGNLGNKKVQIPDGVNTFWPEGDALVHNFVYKDGKIAGFVDTKALAVNDSKSTIINYDYFDIELPFTEGEIAITRGERSKYFNVRYKPINVIVTLKYKGCKTVDDVIAADPDYKTTGIVDGIWSEGLGDLENGNGMFYYCSNLKSFSGDLSSLTVGYDMFSYCYNLTSFTSDLSSLSYGYMMFSYCDNLTSFNSNLSNLVNSDGMFWNCYNLTSFSSDLSSLVIGAAMFNGCENLTSFSANLSSLMWGNNMFAKCSLDAESVMRIADTIKDITAEKQLYIDGIIPYVTVSDGVYSATRGFMEDGRYVYTYKKPEPYTTTTAVGPLALGINVTNDSSTIKQQLQAFAEEATFDSWADLKQHFEDKGWTVTFQYGGTTKKITYDLRDGEQIIPCQIFAKLVETDKESAQYCTEDASTFYDIEWGHDVTNTDGYTIFDSLEDAMAAWNVFPKENIITTEE